MVTIRANFQEHDLVAVGKIQTHFFEHRVSGSIKHHAAIRGRTNQMIEQHAYIMTLVEILAHSQTHNIPYTFPTPKRQIRSKLRGYPTQTE
jgi:hypothetical protein